jgi:hypothetical protein
MNSKQNFGRFMRAALVLSTLVVWSTGTIDARDNGIPRPAAIKAPPAAVGLDADAWSASARGTVDARVFDLALGAANCAVRSGTVGQPSTLTVIDYSKPSTAKRLWVFDLRSHNLLDEELVAHGQGSGNNFATQFSNQAETHQSSIGLFQAEDTYIGKNGYSLRLKGLDEGFNDNAYDRAIVMHGAAYVNETVAKKQGRLGRSWGCPALNEAVAQHVIDEVKGSGLIFAYYPDQRWLKSSKYLGQCGATS